MKFSNLKHIFPMVALSLSLGLGSCVNDLDVEPIDPSTIMKPDFDALFNKCYANMVLAGNSGPDGDCDIDGLDGGTTGFVRQLFNANELTTDEAICCWGDEGIPAFNYNQWSASHPMLKGFYYRLYFGVTMCNFYLKEAEGYNEQMSAEVRFLRALYYYYLMDGWGNIAFLTEVSSEPAPQKSRAEVYAFIESELKAIEPLLAEPKQNTYGRVDKAAAWLLLSRLYLNAEVYTGTAQWQLASDYANKVMTSGYALSKESTGDWSGYQKLFMADNNTNGAQVEAILPLIQTGNQTAAYGCFFFLMQSTIKDDMLTYGGTPFNSSDNPWAGNRCRPDFVKKFFPNTSEDQLLELDIKGMVQKAGDDRALLWSKDRKYNVEKVSEFKHGFSVGKFNNWRSDGGATTDAKFNDSDFFLMRAAEAWLTYAEAETRLGAANNLANAKKAIDEIRDRAHAPKQPAYSLDFILDEWSREFYFEGRRRIDLIRHDKFSGGSYLWQWKGGSYDGTTFSSHLNIFAIPDTDLNANENLQQNPGY